MKVTVKQRRLKEKMVAISMDGRAGRGNTNEHQESIIEFKRSDVRNATRDHEGFAEYSNPITTDVSSWIRL